MSVLLTLKSQLSTKVTVLDKKKSVQHKKKNCSHPPPPPAWSLYPPFPFTFTIRSPVDDAESGGIALVFFRFLKRVRGIHVLPFDAHQNTGK